MIRTGRRAGKLTADRCRWTGSGAGRLADRRRPEAPAPGQKSI